MVRLVTEIGMEFDVQIPAEELVPENFQNVNTIMALIERLDEE
jgi:acyl carrier protein